MGWNYDQQLLGRSTVIWSSNIEVTLGGAQDIITPYVIARLDPCRATARLRGILISTTADRRYRGSGDSGP